MPALPSRYLSELGWSMSPKQQSSNIYGFTLIEIIVTIVVLAIASTALLSVFSSTAATSANPVIQQQAISIAEAYLEEISQKSFIDPDGIAEANDRSIYDNVADYNNLLGTVVSDQNNIAVTGLSDYEVTVTITNVALNTTNGAANTIPAADSFRIDIIVAHPAIDSIAITGYRTKY